MARKITIEFLGDDSDLSKTTTSAGKSTSSLGDKLKKVGKIAAIGLAAGVAVAGKALFDMTKAAAEDEAAQVRLANTLKNAAGATDAQVASVEKWISAQGKALGVTDDELRPALDKLVTATGDVGEAQKLAGLAMDISAKSGKSLDSVSQSLAKAYNGSAAGLAKYGINVKDASGKTVDFETAQRRLAEVSGGAAAAQAETLSGKMQRLKVMLSEAGEEIGAKLIPVVTALADWFGAKVMPVIEAFGTYLGEVLPPIFDRIGEVISGVFSGETSGKVSEALGLIQEIIVGYVELITAVWNKWGDEIVATITWAWDLISGIVKAALDIISGVIKVVTGIIKGDWGQVWDGIKQILSGAWDAIKVILSAALTAVKAILRAGWDALKDLTKLAWEGIKQLPGLALDAIKALLSKSLEGYKILFREGWEALKDVTRAAWEGLKDLVKAGADRIVDGVKAIPGRLRDLGGVFKDAGRWIIDKFVEGLKNAAGVISGIAGNVWDAVRGLLNGGIDKINAALEFTISIPMGPDLHVNPPNIPHLAKGGIVTRPTLALIGEDGPEAVVPLGDKHRPRGTIPGLGGGNAGGIVINISGALDPLAVAQQVQTVLLQLKRINGGIELGLA